MSSKVQATTRPFRILALPLARLPRSVGSSPTPSSQPALDPNPPSSPTTPSPTSSTPSPSPTKKSIPAPLILFHAIQPEPTQESGPPSLTTKALDKASDQWLKLGAKPKNSWMYWFYSKGESLMDKIEYEEWSLKNIHEGRGVRIAKEGETQQKIEIPLLRPNIKDTPLPPLIPKLHRFLLHRIPHHRKMMWRSIILTPFTWPFAIIPIIPNFPMFYVLWRAWSHYRAWRGAVYLESLVKLGMITEKESARLTEIYDSKGMVVGPEGAENVAPDSTSSKGMRRSKDTAIKGVVGGEEIVGKEGEKGGGEIPPQAEGKGPAPDGTHTPETMIYHGAHDQHLAEPPLKTQTQKQQHTELHIRHPNVLLGINQVPMITKAYTLKPNEVIDVNRAVEQANLRAVKADKEREVQKAEGEEKKEREKVPPATEWRGNLHR